MNTGVRVNCLFVQYFVPSLLHLCQFFLHSNYIVSEIILLDYLNDLLQLLSSFLNVCIFVPSYRSSCLTIVQLITVNYGAC